MPGFFDNIYKNVNDWRVKKRAELADFANRLGGAHDVMDPGEKLHQDTSQNLTRLIGSYLPVNPRTAAGMADLAGQANETLTGNLQRGLLNKPYYSDAGYDYGDIAQNRIGQDKGIKDLEVQNANPSGVGLIMDALRKVGGYDLVELGQKGLEKFATTKPGQSFFGDAGGNDYRRPYPYSEFPE